MITDRISTEDILNLAAGQLVAKLPSYKAIESAKNLVTRVKSYYPREDITYTTSVDKKTNTITIKLTEKHEDK